MNFLASPPLVVAYAIAGTMDIDLMNDPVGTDENAKAIYLKDIWPSQAEINETMTAAINSEMFRAGYENVFAGEGLRLGALS